MDPLAKHPSDQASDRGGVLAHGGGGVRTDQAGQVVPGAGAGDEVGDLPLDE
jgi:hypothetical protein